MNKPTDEITAILDRLNRRLAGRSYPGRMMQVKEDVRRLAELWKQHRKGNSA